MFNQDELNKFRYQELICKADSLYLSLENSNGWLQKASAVEPASECCTNRLDARKALSKNSWNDTTKACMSIFGISIKTVERVHIGSEVDRNQ